MGFYRLPTSEIRMPTGITLSCSSWLECLQNCVDAYTNMNVLNYISIVPLTYASHYRENEHNTITELQR